MQDQLKKDENGITLSAYTLEKLSRSMWNKPEARSRHQLWFWEISTGNFSFDKNAVSLNLSRWIGAYLQISTLSYAALGDMGCGSSKQQVTHKQFIKTFRSFSNVF
jgi:hypothetical protein